MGLPQFSIRRPVTILMCVIGAVLGGIALAQKLPVELLPNISFGDITIFTEVRGGIPPPEVESQVTRPIEEAMADVSNLANILAISKEGESRVILSFEPGTDMDFSPLISMVTLPVATNRDRASRITATSASTIAVNMPTPRKIVSIIPVSLKYQFRRRT